LDDQHCIAYAWGNFGERGDPQEYNTPEGMQKIEQGEILKRSYEERQRRPGDVEAVEGMGLISDHEREYLVPGDRGVTLYRRQIRQLARNLQQGHPPPQPTDLGSSVIPTYGSDTVLYRPLQSITDDRGLLRDTGAKVMDILFDSDNDPAPKRDEHIINKLKKLG
jgi:hypothetical protein